MQTMITKDDARTRIIQALKMSIVAGSPEFMELQELARAFNLSFRVRIERHSWNRFNDVTTEIRDDFFP